MTETHSTYDLTPKCCDFIFINCMAKSMDSQNAV